MLKCPHILSRLKIDADGGKVPPRLVWRYQPKSSITNLRNHLRRMHAKAYFEKCNEKNWPIMIPSLRPTLMSQTSIEQFAQLGVKPRLSFSPSQLLSALVNWIVADDQVIPFHAITIKPHF